MYVIGKPELIKFYHYGKERFNIFVEVKVNGDNEHFQNEMFRSWINPPPHIIKEDLYYQFEVNVCDEVEVCMGNGGGSGKAEFWTKYKILERR